MTAIFKREFKSYFTSPLGYVYIAIFLFFEGLYFASLYASNAPMIEYIFPMLTTAIVFTTPVLTMRLLSEERRQKIDQALLTAPVKISSVVLGKFFSSVAVFCVALLPVWMFQIVTSFLAKVNWLVFLNAALGTLLVGAALIAIGMFISSLTESSVISCVLTLVIFLLLMVLPSLTSILSISWLTNIAQRIAFINLLSSFSEAIFRIKDVIYLLSISTVFVFLSIRAVEKRRWA